MIARAVLLALALLAAPALAFAADPKAPPAATPPPPVLPGLHPSVPPTPGAPPGMGGELDCKACHQREHAGIVRMYLGTGGRGTPRMSSHMADLRVECVACHVDPKEVPGAAQIVGQTFKVGEKACVQCHGEKYRGMMVRWTTTLAKMREIVDGKLSAARAAVEAAPKSPNAARAKKLLDDAEYNSRFVKLGRGAHNPFYAADLLKLANVWSDEIMVAVGKSPVKMNDVLVRGGYCAVLCHEQAGVKVPATVTFGKQQVPHARHVAEFGATCTGCHSAETHKAVSAKPADCASCHHGPLNERCESCHKAQSALYRGTLDTKLVSKVEPNSMANAVGCTGCHDMAKKHSRAAVGQKCLACHDKSYEGFVTEWTTGLDADVKKTTAAVRDAETAIQKARRAGKKTPEADALAKDARDALAVVTRARGAHNPPAAESLLAAAREKAAAATARVNGR